MTVVTLPTARRCGHVDLDTGEQCITLLCSINPGPDCFHHTRRRTPVRPIPEGAPSAEWVADGLRRLGVQVAA